MVGQVRGANPSARGAGAAAVGTIRMWRASTAIRRAGSTGLVT
ncbi:hypothetical protein FLP41_08215 [Paracoccus marcusii]|nr:hypothetical protein FLP41_08215 [Paracoccus marcusii]